MRVRADQRKQRGAIAVAAAIAVSAGLVALALAIDVGRLYAAQRDLQRVANLAALDAARVAGGCMGVAVDPQAAAFNETLASVERNGGRRSRITPQQVELGRDFLAGDGRHYFDAAVERRNHAVRVTLTRPAPTRLMPLLPAAADLTAVAAAHSRPYASVHIGSQLVEFDPDWLNSFFAEAFGADQALTISAVGYTSLFEATVPMDAVIDTLIPGTADQMRFRDGTVAAFVRRLADSLADQGNTTAAAAARQLADAAERGEVDVLPEEILLVEREAVRLVAGGLIGAGELTLFAAQAATGSAVFERLYSLPPPLGASTVRLRFIDPGKIAFLTPGSPADPQDEPNYASNAQVVLQSAIGFDAAELGPGLRLPIWLQVAQATAEVTDIHCARSGQPRDVAIVDARSSIGRVGIGEFKDIAASQPQAQPATLFDGEVGAGLLGLPVPVRISIRGYAAIDIPAVRERLVFEGPFTERPRSMGGMRSAAAVDALSRLPSAMDLQVEIRPTAAGEAQNAGISATALRIALDQAEIVIEQVLKREIARVLVLGGDFLVTRALQDAGLSLGGADVRVYDVTAKEPVLFTR